MVVTLEHYINCPQYAASLKSFQIYPRQLFVDENLHTLFFSCCKTTAEIEECKCNECGKTFKTGKGLKIHISKIHGKPSCQITSNVKTPKSTIEQETKYDTQFQCQKLDKNQDHDGCNSIISKEKVPVMLDEEPSSLKSSDNQQETEKAGFNCNHCEKSFKTIRGLKTHVSKSHKVSTKNGHDNPSLPVNEDTSDNAAVEKKENSDEDVLQKEDSVEACSNEDEESVLDDSELVSSPIIEDTSMLSYSAQACALLNGHVSTDLNLTCEIAIGAYSRDIHERGLKTHVSKSHKVSTQNGHEGPEKKRKSSTDGDEFQNEDIVAPSSYEGEESVLGVQSSLFKCNMCEKSFKTNRGLKQHVSKSHKVSVLPINEDTSGTERPGKKEKSSADEDKCQNEDIVEARSNNAEGFNENGHDNPSLPVNEDTSDNAAVEKKENSDEDVLQKEDSVEACSNEDEESVLDNSELVSSPIIEDTSMLSCVQSAVFKCNLNEKII
ncbi:KRAB [Mytilus edulis]|uniref:KRAB n=1 Tax=Mytilus edulis TaxID=6550 RepID=A0A8S3TLR2_MYTED|nr:KRAB [Mytilus edulis]